MKPSTMATTSPGAEREPPADPGRADREQHRERGRDGPEVAGREVDGAVRPPDERDAEGEQGAEPADDRALRDDALGHVPDDKGKENDGCREQQRHPGCKRRCAPKRRSIHAGASTVRRGILDGGRLS